MIAFLSLTLGALAASIQPGAAATCVEQVDDVAAAYDLTVDPPDAQGMPPSADRGTSRRLGRSGGVIEPPRVDDPAVIEPREGVRYGMPTMPELAPDQAPPDSSGTVTTLNAQDRAVLASLLVAARADGERGNAADCFRKLRKAREFLEDKK